MMKKLLVLTLVLGMASLSSAAFDLGDIDGLGYSVTGNTVTVTGTNVGGYLMSLAADDGSVLSNGIVAPEFTAVNDPGSFYYGEWTGASAANTSYVTGTIFTIDFTPGASLLTFTYSGIVGASEITIAGQATSLVDATMTLAAIPEPATMALLGLGGLFLRRKK
jgi:hypothetical protein